MTNTALYLIAAITGLAILLSAACRERKAGPVIDFDPSATITTPTLITVQGETIYEGIPR